MALKNDDMYEGGEDEVQKNADKDLENEHGTTNDDDSSDDEFDLDAEDDQADEKRMKKRVKEILDWRTEMDGFNAFFKNRLRPNDY